MHARFAQSLTLALAGGFIVVASQAFVPGVIAWLAFAIGVAAVILASVPAVSGARRWILGLDALTAVLGVWTVVASLVFSGAVVRWLSFGEGAALVSLALAGLVVDHIRLARIAHAIGHHDDAIVAPAERNTPVEQKAVVAA